MYVHRRCTPSGAVLDFGKKAGGFCHSCKQQGTIYHVRGTDDYYQHILNGVLYDVVKGETTTPMTPVWEAAKLQRAKVKAARKGENWTETPVEPELAEEDEALAEVIEEAVEAEIEAAVPEEREPEETKLEVEPLAYTDITEPVEGDIEEPLEAEPEPSVEIVDKIDKNAEIARLEAELAELKK